MSFSICCPLVINQHSTEKEPRIVPIRMKPYRYMTRDDFMNTIFRRKDDEYFK